MLVKDGSTPIWTEGSFGLPPIGLTPFGLTPIGLGLPPFGLPPIWTNPQLDQFGGISNGGGPTFTSWLGIMVFKTRVITNLNYPYLVKTLLCLFLLCGLWVVIWDLASADIVLCWSPIGYPVVPILPILTKILIFHTLSLKLFLSSEWANVAYYTSWSADFEHLCQNIQIFGLI